MNKIFKAFGALVAGYLLLGVVTALFFVTIIGPADFESLVRLVIGWPVFWFMAFVFAAAATA